MTDPAVLIILGIPLALLFASCYIARLAGGSWGWAAWGIFGPLGWIAAFALAGAMKAHEAADRRGRWDRAHVYRFKPGARRYRGKWRPRSRSSS